MRRLSILSLATLSLVMLACGDDDADTSGDIAAVTQDFSFTPTNWTVAAGQEVTLTLTNSGSQVHEWVIMSAPITSGADFTEDAVIWEMEAAAGSVATDTFTAPAAGTYQIICAIEGHFDSGMEGELVVTG